MEWYKVETTQETADRAMNIFCEVGKTSWRVDKCQSTANEGSFFKQQKVQIFLHKCFFHFCCILDYVFYETTQGYCPYQVHLIRQLWSWVLSYCRLVQQCMNSQNKLVIAFTWIFNFYCLRWLLKTCLINILQYSILMIFIFQHHIANALFCL